MLQGTRRNDGAKQAKQVIVPRLGKVSIAWLQMPYSEMNCEEKVGEEENHQDEDSASSRSEGSRLQAVP